jgi:hypothetical protein
MLDEANFITLGRDGFRNFPLEAREAIDQGRDAAHACGRYCARRAPPGRVPWAATG